MKNFVTLTQKWEVDQYTPKAASTLFQSGGFISYSAVSFGGATTEFTITNPSGFVFRYTYNGVGTNPVINATTVPVGTLLAVSGQNFAVANNGVFSVVASGADFFEVVNNLGVVGANQALGIGSIVTSGGVIPSVAAEPILGLGEEDVLASDVDFTSNRAIAYQEVGPNNYFNIPVGLGASLLYVLNPGPVFQVGELVTGTSLATGVIVSDNGATQMFADSLSGAFVAGDVLTGAISGATAVLTFETFNLANASMVGSVFDLLTPQTLNVTAVGTQIVVTKYISPALVEGKVVLFA